MVWPVLPLRVLSPYPSAPRHCGYPPALLACLSMMRIFPWLLPGGAVTVVVLLISLELDPGGLTQGIGGSVVGVAAGVVALMAAYFHRSRLVLFSLALAALEVVVAQGPAGQTGLWFMGGLLALAMGMLVAVQDRGLLSKGGLIQAGLFLAFFLMGWVLLAVAPEDMSKLLDLDPLPPDLTSWSEVPQPVLLALFVSLSTTMVLALVRQAAPERGVFWALVLVALALPRGGEPASVSLFLLGAVVVLGLSVLETSYAMAYKDDLTGLPARRALMRDLHALGGTYSAAMVDVDHFKRFNDRYGHDVGDQVLRMVAAHLARAPGGGKAYRYGGEEFTLLYPGRTLAETLPHLKAARRSVEDAVFILRSWRRPRKKPVDPSAWRASGKEKPKRLSVTVSIGAADSTGKDASPDIVLKRADRALYRAKKGGRNRVAK